MIDKYLEAEKKIKVGILGCANIARRSLIPAFHGHSAFVLGGIASRHVERAHQVADPLGCPAMTYDDLVRSDVDLIYIPLPNALHYEWVMKCLAAGKHVLCEKSLGCTLEEVAEMVEAARKRQLLLMESFQWRFHSQTQTAKAIVDSGQLGDIRCFRALFGFPPFPDRANIRYQKTLGGGALLDAGAYTLKATTEFLGSDVAVRTATLRMDPEVGIDLGGGIYLERADGVVSETAFGFDNFYQCQYEIWGSKGKLTVKRAFTAPPGFEPEIVLETSAGVECRKLPSDDHFARMLDYLSTTLRAADNKGFEREWESCTMQADLIQQTRNLADER